MISLIVAVDKNNLIGNGKKLPWHIKEELVHFKNTTLNQAIFIGGNTYASMPNLSGRDIYIFTQDKNFQTQGDEKLILSFEEAKNIFKKYEDSEEILYIAGGKFVYEQFYKNAKQVILTVINGEFEGDTYLKVNFDKLNMKKTLISENEKFSVYKYQ